jgi:hypothetical protein
VPTVGVFKYIQLKFLQQKKSVPHYVILRLPHTVRNMLWKCKQVHQLNHIHWLQKQLHSLGIPREPIMFCNTKNNFFRIYGTCLAEKYAKVIKQQWISLLSGLTDWAANQPTNQLTNSIQKSSSWEASSSLAIQEIAHFLWNLKVHYYINEGVPLIPVLSQMNQIHVHPHYLRSSLIIFSPRPMSSKWPLSFRFTNQNPYAFFPPIMCHKPCLFHPPLFHCPNNIWQGVQIIKILIIQPSSVTSSLRPKYLAQHQTLKQPQPTFSS